MAEKVDGISAKDTAKMGESYDKAAEKAGSVFSGRSSGGGSSEVGAAARVEPAKSDGFDISDEAKGKE